MGFSRQECLSGLSFPSPADLPDLGFKLSLLHCRWTLYHLSHQESPICMYICLCIFRPFKQDMNMNLSKLQEVGRDRESMGLQRVRHDWMIEQQKQQLSVYLSVCLSVSLSILLVLILWRPLRQDPFLSLCRSLYTEAAGRAASLIFLLHHSVLSYCGQQGPCGSTQKASRLGSSQRDDTAGGSASQDVF